ncbi:MAG: ABC transporter permease [Dehalococcoidia bacterium]|nr:ABC transporter permease [Dehalococcoidia bacterium]
MLAGQERAGVEVLAAAEELALPRQPGWLFLVGRFIRRKPLGAFGLAVVLLMAVAAAGAPWLSRYDAEEFFRVANPNYLPGSLESAEKLDSRSGPSWRHWFGTDQLSRDNYARVVWGARRSLGVGLGAMLFAIIFGTTIGIVSAYYRGWLDMFVQRIMDSIQAFPAMFILLLLVSLTQLNLVTLSLGLGFVVITSAQRIVRSAVLSAREDPHVEAARAIGCSPIRLMTVHILPNVAAPIIVIFSIGIASVILAEAALAFLGLAPIEPPSWGMMLDEGRRYMTSQPSTMLAGGAAITLAVMGFNLAGDALRDILDPRIRLT